MSKKGSKRGPLKGIDMSAIDMSTMAEDSLPVPVVAFHAQPADAFDGPPRVLELFDRIKIGRCINTKTEPAKTNAYFNNSTLSRVHAEIWADLKTHEVFVKDLGSSNGTYLNGQRLSAEGVTSEPFKLTNGSTLTFGMDMATEDNQVAHRKIGVFVRIAQPGESLRALTEPVASMPALKTPAQALVDRVEALQDAPFASTASSAASTPSNTLPSAKTKKASSPALLSTLMVDDEGDDLTSFSASGTLHHPVHLQKEDGVEEEKSKRNTKQKSKKTASFPSFSTSHGATAQEISMQALQSALSDDSVQTTLFDDDREEAATIIEPSRHTDAGAASTWTSAAPSAFSSRPQTTETSSRRNVDAITHRLLSKLEEDVRQIHLHNSNLKELSTSVKHINRAIQHLERPKPEESFKAIAEPLQTRIDQLEKEAQTHRALIEQLQQHVHALQQQMDNAQQSDEKRLFTPNGFLQPSSLASALAQPQPVSSSSSSASGVPSAARSRKPSGYATPPSATPSATPSRQITPPGGRTLLNLHHLRRRSSSLSPTREGGIGTSTLQGVGMGLLATPALGNILHFSRYQHAGATYQTASSSPAPSDAASAQDQTNMGLGTNRKSLSSGGGSQDAKPRSNTLPRGWQYALPDQALNEEEPLMKAPSPTTTSIQTEANPTSAS